MKMILFVGGLAGAIAAEPPPPPSRVVIARDEQAVHLFAADAPRVTAMLDRAILTLTRQKDVAAAWKQFVQPSDIVGIKISTHGGSLGSTHRPLVDAILAGLERAGVPADHIIVWDRYAVEMNTAGYPLREEAGKVKYLATTPQEGGDENFSYQSGLVGKPLWGDFDFPRATISDKSYLSRIVTQRCTKIINVPVLTDHRDAGLAGCLYHLAIGSVDNSHRFAADPWRYDPAVAEILAMEPFRNKTVLHILDGLIAQYEGGPSFQPRFCWNAGTIYLGRDPVAIDTLALQEIEAHRKANGLPSVTDRAKHLASAVELELGTNQRDKIEVVETH